MVQLNNEMDVGCEFSGHFKKIKNKGVDLSGHRAVAVGMKVVNGLTYRIELDDCVMLSRCLVVPLRSDEPILLQGRWWCRFLQRIASARSVDHFFQMSIIIYNILSERR